MMKQLLPLLIASITFASCGPGGSEDKNSDPQDSKVVFTFSEKTNKDDVVSGRINADASFDGIYYKIDLEIENATLVALWMTGTVAYNANGRNDQLAVSQTLETTLSQTIYLKFKEIRGNTFPATVYARVRNKYSGQEETFSKGVAARPVFAVQPDNEAIRKYVGLPDVDIVMYKLSKFKKFDKDGQPLYSGSFGLFNDRQPKAEDIWHWKKDADKGKADWLRRSEETKMIPAKLRDSDPVKYKGLPDFTPEQLLVETFQTYGQGRAYEPVRKGIIKHWEWQEIATSDGTGKTMLGIKKNVAAGKFPDGWN